MAVEYETTPSTPGNPNANSIFPLGNNAVKKRVMKHTSQENFRAGLFFCGKRKRSHRDRYHDYDHYRLHSSSVPRQREFFTPKNSYLEYKSRSRNPKAIERILPLNRNIISKIEKIAQDSSNNSGCTIGFINNSKTNDEKNVLAGFSFNSFIPPNRTNANEMQFKPETNVNVTHKEEHSTVDSNQSTSTNYPFKVEHHGHANKLQQKSGSFDSTFSVNKTNSTYTMPQLPIIECTTKTSKDTTRKNPNSRHSNHKRKQSRRNQMKMQIQFDVQNGMDCGTLNDFLSSSSLSSSDSEDGETNESDREGDDELTDWPGNEAMVNFASKNDFKRAKPARCISNPIGIANKTPILHGKFLNDDLMAQDEDTLMSADELPLSPNTTQFSSTVTSTSQLINANNSIQTPNSLVFPLKLYTSSSSNRLPLNESQTLSSPSTSDNQLHVNANRSSSSMPIDIAPQSSQHSAAGGITSTQIESEMSGETSNHFLSSPNMEVREIRAGCRRIRDERPGFSIFSSVNEHLSRFVIA